MLGKTVSQNSLRSIAPPVPVENLPRRKTAAGDVAEAKTDSQRPVFPAILASTILHLLAALALCLIALGDNSPSEHIAMTVVKAKPTLVNELETFELADVSPVQEPEEEIEVKPELQMTVEVSAPTLPKTETPPPETSSQAEPAVSENTTPVSTTLAQPMSRAAMGIQKRVSEAGGSKGEVQFALAWRNINDLDLHVICPSGERISHLRKSSRCGGLLDVDMNVRGESNQPVENIRWLENAPAGRYSVLVNLFRVHRPRAGDRAYRGADFQLLAKLGEESQLEKGIVNSGGRQYAVLRFIYLPARTSDLERESRLARIEQLQENEEKEASRDLVAARKIRSQTLRDRALNFLINRYPHTDAAITAMRLLGGSITKNGF
ncbi:MAG: hypothetical protein VXZ82_23915 [Planctomycetota bacterium]|nr:hypothetical protein [Planctomycetota bacterium]